MFHFVRQSQHLSRIGGCNVKEIVRRIMYYIFTNEVGMTYSWEGAKKKKVFKNLAVTSTIFCKLKVIKCLIIVIQNNIIIFIWQ